MNVRELITVLGFKVDPKGLNEAEAKTKSFAASARSAAAGAVAIGTAVVGASIAIFKFTEAVANNGDVIAKTARDIGISGEALQEWRYSADLAGISAGELDSNLLMFTKRMGEVSQFGTGAAKDALDQMGISIYNANGTMRDTNDILLDVSDRFGGMKDEAAKAAYATALFGRSGQRMATWLSLGREEIQKNKQELRSLGGVMSEDALTASELFMDNILRMKTAFNGLRMQLAQRLMPVVNDFIVVITKNLQGPIQETMANVAQLVGTLLPPLLQIVFKVLGAVMPLVQTVNTLAFSVAGLVDRLTPAVDKILGAVGLIIGVIGKVIDGLLPLIDTVFGAVADLVGGLAGVLGDSIGMYLEAFMPIIEMALELINMLLPVLQPILKIWIFLITLSFRLKALLYVIFYKILFAALAGLLRALWPLIKIILTILAPAISLIGKLFDGVGGKAGGVFGAIMKAIDFFAVWVGRVFEFLGTTLLLPFTLLFDFVKTLFETDFRQLFADVVAWISLLFSNPVEAIKQLWYGILDVINMIIGNVLEKFGFVIDWLNVLPGVDIEKPKGPAATLAGAGGSTNTGGNTFQVNAPVSVTTGSGDPGAIGGAVQGAVQAAFSLEFKKLIVEAGI